MAHVVRLLYLPGACEFNITHSARAQQIMKIQRRLRCDGDNRRRGCCNPRRAGKTFEVETCRLEAQAQHKRATSVARLSVGVVHRRQTPRSDFDPEHTRRACTRVSCDVQLSIITFNDIELGLTSCPEVRLDAGGHVDVNLTRHRQVQRTIGLEPSLEVAYAGRVMSLITGEQ